MDREELLKEQLENEKTEQVVALRLNKNKVRELELRAYLDQKLKYGLNRKDTILRMFETLKENGLLDLDIATAEKEDKTRIEKVSISNKANLDLLED